MRGTYAVVLGYFLHVSPLGTFNWNLPDLVTGLAFAIPIILLDAAVMLPKWEPELVTKTLQLRVPREVAARIQMVDPSATVTALADLPPADLPAGDAAGAAPAAARAADGAAEPAPAARAATAVAERPASYDPGASVPGAPAPEMVQLERTVRVRGAQRPLRDALYRAQMDRAVNNVGRLLGPASEAALLGLVHLSEEMLYRGVALTYAARWATDRLYEGGAEEAIAVAAGLEVPTPAAGAALAAAGLTVVAVGLVAQRQLFPLRMLQAAAARGAGGKRAAGGAGPAAARKLAANAAAAAGGKDRKLEQKQMAALEQVARSVARQQRWSVALAAAHELAEWGALSAAFLATGNLLAPLAASVVADGLFSGWQRLRFQRAASAQLQQSRDVVERARKQKQLLQAVQESRKARLQPPAAGAGVQEAQEAAGESKQGGAAAGEEAPAAPLPPGDGGGGTGEGSTDGGASGSADAETNAE